jgi:hypothetical protein
MGAFFDCESLTNVTIGNSVTNMGDWTFGFCPSLMSVCCRGNAPSLGGGNVFYGNLATIYYLAGATNWGPTLDGHPAVLWNPAVPYTYTINSDGITLTITGYTGSGGAVTIPDSINFLPVEIIGDDAFLLCTSLTSVTMPNSVTSIGYGAFYTCPSLTNVYFTGNAPAPTNDLSVFAFDNNTTAYYLRGTPGWGATFDGLPTALWLPRVQTPEISFGVRTNQFGFNISWASGQTVVVEASTNLSNPDWQPVSTNTLTTGSAWFSDPQWTNYPGRFYRLRSP